MALMKDSLKFKTACDGSLARYVVGLLLVVMLAPSSVHAAETPRATLTAEERIEIDGPDIRLGQIANIAAGSTALKERLGRIKIGRAAPAGKSRNISRDYILLRLRQNGFDPGTFDIRLPEKLRVHRSAVRVSREEMEMMIRDYFQAQPLSAEAQVNLTAVRIREDVVLPKGAIHHDIQVQPPSAPSRMLPVAIAFTVDGRFERKVSAMVHLEMMQNVVVSRRPIPRFKVITAEDVMLRQLDVAGLSGHLLRSLEDVIGKRARRAIGMHAEVQANMVEWPPVVQKGDRVLIVAESGNLRITAVGKVKTMGRIGDQVRVVNLDSQKTIMAQVVDGRTVRVAF
jgi:flagella basal body P-ring formation protein FlgA